MGNINKGLFDWFITKPGYLKSSNSRILLFFNLKNTKKNNEIINDIKKQVKLQIDQNKRFKEVKPIFNTDIPKLIKNSSNLTKTGNFNKNNVLIIGDTHFPFEKEGYLDFCLDTQKKYNAGTIIHIGDVADNCYSSFHDNNPDGLAAGDELQYAIKSAKEWGKAFPNVKVTLGNHCQIIQRKAFSSGVSSKWIKGLNEVLELPGWNFEMEFEINGVLYTHGTGTSGDKAAYNKALHRRKSIVQGHLHSQASIMWNTSNIDKIFAMQVGCGVDETKYAFDYAKNFPKKFIISCGLVLENGQLPIIELMKL